MYFSAGKRMSYKGEIVNYGDPDDLKPRGSGFNHIAIPTIIHSPYIYTLFFCLYQALKSVLFSKSLYRRKSLLNL